MPNNRSTSLNAITKLLKQKQKSSNSSESLNRYGASYESFSNPDSDYVLTADVEFARECYDIVNNYNSYEELDASFMAEHNQMVLSVEMVNAEIIKYYKNVASVEAFIQKFKNSPRGMEAVVDMINILSIESVGGFFKKTFESFKIFFRKIITQGVKLIKMFTTFTRGKLAETQNGVYTKYSGSIAEMLRKHGDTTAKYKMFDKNIVKNIPGLTAKLIGFSSTIDSDLSKGSADVAVSSVINKINKALGRSEGGENSRAAVNRVFFGEAKQPKSAEHKINELLTPETFKAASKEWLSSLHDLTKATDSLSKTATKALKLVEKAESITAKSKSEEVTDDDKSRARENVKALSAARMEMQVYQMYIRDYFWTALDFRSTICSLAKKLASLDNKATKAENKAAKKAEKEAAKKQGNA